MAFKDLNFLPGVDRRVVVNISMPDNLVLRSTTYRAPNYDPGATIQLWFCNIPTTVQERSLPIKQETGLFYLQDYSAYCFPYLVDWRFTSSAVAFGSMPSDPDGEVVILPGRIQWQSLESAPSEVTYPFELSWTQFLHDYAIHGAAIRAWSVVMSLDEDTNLEHGSTQQLEPLFKGIVNSFSTDGRGVLLEVVGDKSYNTEKPDAQFPPGSSEPSIISRDRYPKAPDDSIGGMIPIVFRNSPILIEDVRGLAVTANALADSWYSPCTYFSPGEDTAYAKVVGMKVDDIGQITHTAKTKAFFEGPDGDVGYIYNASESYGRTDFPVTFNRPVLGRCYIRSVDFTTNIPPGALTNSGYFCDDNPDHYTEIDTSGQLEDWWIKLRIKSGPGSGQIYAITTYSALLPGDGTSLDPFGAGQTTIATLDDATSYHYMPFPYGAKILSQAECLAGGVYVGGNAILWGDGNLRGIGGNSDWGGWSWTGAIYDADPYSHEWGCRLDFPYAARGMIWRIVRAGWRIDYIPSETFNSRRNPIPEVSFKRGSRAR